MANYALMTAVGKDQPGIVAAISGVLFEADCNIEDSQMARLGPDFACMLLLALPEGWTSNQLDDRLRKVREQFKLWIHLADLLPEEATGEPHDHPVYNIHVYGADRKGIVHRITKHLAEQSINISNLHTEVIPHKEPLYVMLIEVEVPPFVDTAKLQRNLKAIGNEIGVQVSVKQKDDARF
jgi:glycine cleavage system transcriptional repressor